ICAGTGNGGRHHFTLLGRGGSRRGKRFWCSDGALLSLLRPRHGGSQTDENDQKKASSHGDAAAHSDQCFTSIFRTRAPSIRIEPTAALYSRWRRYKAVEKPPTSSSAAVPGR